MQWESKPQSNNDKSINYRKIKEVFAGQNPETAAPFIIISNNLNAAGNPLGMLHYTS